MAVVDHWRKPILRSYNGINRFHLGRFAFDGMNEIPAPCRSGYDERHNNRNEKHSNKSEVESSLRPIYQKDDGQTSQGGQPWLVSRKSNHRIGNGQQKNQSSQTPSTAFRQNQENGKKQPDACTPSCAWELRPRPPGAKRIESVLSKNIAVKTDCNPRRQIGMRDQSDFIHLMEIGIPRFQIPREISCRKPFDVNRPVGIQRVSVCPPRCS